MPKRNFAPGEVLTATNVNTYLTGTNNFLLNGGFNFWQRGTSFTASGYTADRWYFSYGGTVTVARESTVIPANSTYATKVTTGASSSFGELYQALESQVVNLIAGSTITVSAYVRAQASFSGNAVLALQTNTTADTQTGGTWTEVVSAEVAPTTTGFTRLTATYALPAGTKGLRVRLAMKTAQASGTGLFWGNVQLEEGFAATPFALAASTLQGELAACQRYFWVGGNAALGLMNGATGARFSIQYPVTMRTTPTITLNQQPKALIPTVAESQTGSLGSGTTLSAAAGGLFTNQAASKMDMQSCWTSGSDGRTINLLNDCINFNAEL